MSRSDEQRIVVMGGSFNPPTIAHLRLMEAAMRAVDATKGVFVPVGGAYLKRKMRKSEDHIRLSEQMRFHMLQAMCAGNDRLTVSDLEIQNPLIYTKETMHILRGQYPSARLYFAAGADKLPLLVSFAAKSDFFDHFGVVLFSREGVDGAAFLQENEHLAPYRDAFVHAKQPEGMDGISSTAVRKLISSGEAEKAYPYLHKEVWKMVRRLKPADFPPEIERFEGEYEFLSNSFPSPVVYEGLTFSCAEAAFQAARCALGCDKKRIAQGDGRRAKQMSAKITPIPDWDERKLPVMENVLRAKFSQNPDLANALKATGNAVLIHSGGKDRFWSRDPYTDRGENHLGLLLMKLRTDLKTKEEREYQ